MGAMQCVAGCCEAGGGGLEEVRGRSSMWSCGQGIFENFRVWKFGDGRNIYSCE